MKILFIQGGSRLKQADDGTWYTDPNFNEDVWKRYVDLADSFTILLRRESKIYPKQEAEERFNNVLIDDRIRIVTMPDFTESKFTMINPKTYSDIKQIIETEIKKVDKCFIRTHSVYTKMACDACKKYSKPYLFECTDFVYEALHKHGILGKLLARRGEKECKRMAAGAVQATYVTSEVLQKRYPCASGKMIGVSNVQLVNIDENVLKARLDKIKTTKPNQVLKIGTAAFLDVRWKGQDLVIKALAELKKQGITKFVFEMIGVGKGDYLKRLSKQLGVSDQVKILGALPHDKVFEWLDSIDIYVQSSYQEGLCRAIIEAMSRACPVVCSNAGGNYELISRDYIFECGDYNTLAQKLIDIIPNMAKEAEDNFEKSKRYDKQVLDERRKKFFLEFINA